jgi:hypothetical protein
VGLNVLRSSNPEANKVSHQQCKKQYLIGEKMKNFHKALKTTTQLEEYESQ